MRNAKYQINFRGGKYAGKRQYFPISQDKLEEILGSFKFDVDGRNYAWLGHIAGQNRGDKADELYIDKKKRLLKFECKNKKTANKCAEYFKLPLPFPDFR